MTPSRPWATYYPSDVDPSPRLQHATVAEAWADRCRRIPEEPALNYFGARYTAAETDRMADALAVELQERGLKAGDVVGIQLQNVPQFVIAELAIWKAGGVVLVLNTMYRNRELAHILADARPVGVIGTAGVINESLRRIHDESEDPSLPSPWFLEVQDAELAGPDAARYLGDRAVPGEVSAEHSLAAVLARQDGRVPAPAPRRAEDPAMLTYTSGTTGPPKGAISTHHALLFVALTTGQWLGIRPMQKVLAIAPLFHITGAVATALATVLGDGELVLVNRPTAESIVGAIVDYGVDHLLGSITVFNGLLNLPAGYEESISAVTSAFSGGAPVPPGTVEKFRARFGLYIRNVYGMTETSSAVIGVPRGQEAPVDPDSGSLSVGVPYPGTDLRIVRLEGGTAEIGEIGEIELRGPAVTAGYLNMPEATAETIQDGWLKTGDVGLEDGNGWVYLVDRKKDQINVSGYKVWPREVEDVLYEHPGVLEAAVVGQPDDYSGERVVAYVSVRQGLEIPPEELEELVRDRLAAYKTPKEIVVLDDLPKTATGKIQRRALKQAEPRA